MNLKTKNSDPIAKEGYPFIGGFFAASMVSRALKLKWLELPFAALGVFSLYFFRNPDRTTPDFKRGVISAADGVVVYSGMAEERFFLKKEAYRISVFMSLFDVHINRAPVDGVVIDRVYNKGRFLPANIEKSSLENEQSALLIKSACGVDVVVVQVAGLVARRIETYKKPEDAVNRGEIIGMIRFGSRVDIYVDGNFEPTVVLNEKVKAGVSLLGLIT